MKMIIDLKNKMELIVAFYLIYLIALLSYALALAKRLCSISCIHPIFLKIKLK